MLPLKNPAISTLVKELHGVHQAICFMTELKHEANASLFMLRFWLMIREMGAFMCLWRSRIKSKFRDVWEEKGIRR